MLHATDRGCNLAPFRHICLGHSHQNRGTQAGLDYKRCRRAVLIERRALTKDCGTQADFDRGRCRRAVLFEMVARLGTRGTQGDFDCCRCRRAVLVIDETVLNVGCTACSTDFLELDLEFPGLASLENVNKAKCGPPANPTGIGGGTSSVGTGSITRHTPATTAD